jgi:methyl-accepting chemotaxis protein
LNLSIRAKLAVVAIVASAGAITLAGFNFYSGRANSRALERVYEKNVRSLVELQKIDSTLREIRFRAAGVLLDVMPVQGSLNHVREARKDIEANWRVATADGAENAEEKRLLDAMALGWNVVQATLGKIEQAYVGKNNGQLTEVLETDWAKVHLGYVKPLEALLPLKEAAARSTYEASSAMNSKLTGASIALAVLLTGLTLAVVIWVMRSIANSLRGAVNVARQVAGGDLSAAIEVGRRDEMGILLQAFADMQQSLRRVVEGVQASATGISGASLEIAQGNSDLSSRTEQQASSLEQTAAAMEEMSATVSQNAENARRASEHASAASEVAGRGGRAVATVIGTMDGISASSNKIADIIGVIDGIAFQTNILALNAAVEAARAGEQGRGFAVVASEVRSLAQRSAEAAKEIRQLISESVERISEGSNQVAEAGKTMVEIVQSVKRVNDLIAEIAAASQEQSQSVTQVSDTVQQLEKVTQQNAAMVEEATAASATLRDQAQGLVRSVEGFKLAEGGRADTAPVPKTPPAHVQATGAERRAPKVTALAKRASGRALGNPGGRKKTASGDQESPNEAGWQEF